MTATALPTLSRSASALRACHDCADACDACAAACLREPDVTPMARCIALDVDCASLCRLAAAFLARGSESARALCGVCAAVCDACAAECGRHAHDHCQACAEACRQCATACRSVTA